MKKYVALALLLAATSYVAIGQSVKEVTNRSIDQDTQMCVNKAGVTTCGVVVDGPTGNVVVAPGGEDTTIGGVTTINGNTSVTGTMSSTGTLSVGGEATLEEGIILRGTNQNIGGNERTGVFRMASVNDLAAATTSAVMDIKAGFAVSAALLMMSCHRDVDGNSYTTKMLMWRARNGTEADPALVTSSTYGSGAAFTAKANSGGLSIQNDAGVFIDCTALFIGPAGF